MATRLLDRDDDGGYIKFLKCGKEEIEIYSCPSFFFSLSSFLIVSLTPKRWGGGPEDTIRIIMKKCKRGEHHGERRSHTRGPRRMQTPTFRLSTPNSLNWAKLLNAFRSWIKMTRVHKYIFVIINLRRETRVGNYANIIFVSLFICLLKEFWHQLLESSI